MKKFKGISLFDPNNPFWDKVYSCPRNCQVVADCDGSCKNSKPKVMKTLLFLVAMFVTTASFGQTRWVNTLSCEQEIELKQLTVGLTTNKTATSRINGMIHPVYFSETTTYVALSIQDKIYLIPVNEQGELQFKPVQAKN